MFSGIVLCRFPKKLIRTVVFVLFLCLGMSLIIPQTIRAASSITVSGLTFPRSRVPLVDSSGNVSSDLYEGASNLVSALQDSGNFGAGGTVPCSIDFQPFVTEINPSSLVSGGNRTVDIFFAGVTDTTLSSSEADELATFINAGGIVYISGSAFHHDYGLSNEGPSFNPLFNALGISDSFSTGIDESSFMGESSDPSDTTPITGGPFGNISGMTHWSFRIINTSSLTQLADGFESGGMVVMSVTPGSGLSDEIVLAEGAFSSGYLSVTGDPMYTDFLTGMDSDNLNYFLNLFALGCSDGGEPPTTPTPFLDLPWDYGGKGLSFSDAALAINSFFDHEYPLLSTGLGEPVESRDTVTNFRGKFRTNLEYSSHDGYDWGRKAKATKGESVLAAASGTATYWGSCDACGNAILIDHGNGYQTRYYHLLDEGLIVDQEGQSVSVAKGQQIGLVGFTGRVIPSGERGAHIHFMVIQDKNNDGDFNDNIPDGLTDPFGWQSTSQDPWPDYNFFYKGQQRVGNESYYLWTKSIANLSDQFSSNGGFFQLERYGINIPQGATDDPITINMNLAPIVRVSDILEAIGSTVVIDATGIAGDPVSILEKDFILTIDFSEFDLSGYKEETVSIYSSEDGVDWIKEETFVDMITKTASAQLNHLSYFALMAERFDTTAPTTNAVLSGEEGKDGWFKSDVEVTLNAQDNEGGLGVDYTLYKVNEGDWQEYTSFLNFTDEGDYLIEFYSVDNDENIEDVKSVEFHIDKTPPEAKFQFNLDTLEAEILGLDANATEILTEKDKGKQRQVLTIRDKAGNTLRLIGKFKLGKTAMFSIKSLSYNENDVVEFDKNLFHTHYSQDKKIGDLKSLFQNWFDKKNVFLRIVYKAKDNQSVIFTKKLGHKVQKETRQGFIILSVQTDDGNLVYGYE